ncbi:hypothetical protein GUJ93_ZPchr0006g41092 [Zizania palustris]|uniref:Uncharacterized protein n=1 Tax=Zizania palustris TaxID=103762 RepID=A0A8J5VJU4_ZIZPA|nr:hypothetical protein GUJ93_ZPchr0006g41092 [Zizania palustris]
MKKSQRKLFPNSSGFHQLRFTNCHKSESWPSNLGVVVVPRKLGVGAAELTVQFRGGGGSWRLAQRRLVRGDPNIRSPAPRALFGLRRVARKAGSWSGVFFLEWGSRSAPSVRWPDLPLFSYNCSYLFRPPRGGSWLVGFSFEPPLVLIWDGRLGSPRFLAGSLAFPLIFLALGGFVKLALGW